MKKLFYTIVFGFCLWGAGAQTLPVELQTPEIIAINRVSIRATAFRYENRQQAEKRNKELPAYFLSLNGAWKVHWVMKPARPPMDFYKPDIDDRAWMDFPVPANREVNGNGLPIYVNHPYEFTGHAKKGAQLNPPFYHPLLLRIGNDLQLNKEYQQIEWYGRGPGENYWDRKTASLVGLYRRDLSEQYFPYARPRESGNKTDTRWVKFTNGKERGVQVLFADSLLSFSALPYGLDDLDPKVDKKQYHSGELKERDVIYLHLDGQQTGMPGIDSGSHTPWNGTAFLLKLTSITIGSNPCKAKS